MGERLYRNSLGYYLCVLFADGNTQPCVLPGVWRSPWPSVRAEGCTPSGSQECLAAGCCVSVFLPILIPFSFLSLLSFVRELPSVCAGNLRQGGVGMVYCQRLHCWEATHYTWENFLHLWLWSIYSAVLQRKIWNLRFTTHWCEQEGATSCETGNRTLVLRLQREFIFWCINRSLRKGIKKALLWIPNKKKWTKHVK